MNRPKHLFFPSVQSVQQVGAEHQLIIACTFFTPENEHTQFITTTLVVSPG